MDSIARRLYEITGRIQQAAAGAGRDPAEIALLAVSKTQPAAALRAAWEAGQRRFGESYLQEALGKMAELPGLDIEWHFIGHIQSNKTRPIAERFDWVHGVENLKQARRLSEQRPEGLPPLNVCVQVRIDPEETKGGCEPTALAKLLPEIAGLPRLRLRGLMTLPAPREDLEAQRIPFRALRALRDRLATPECPLETLSMGMSDDLEAAILEGATLVRVGSAIFGSRPTQLDTAP
jgi:PLP dependent protein